MQKKALLISPDTLKTQITARLAELNASVSTLKARLAAAPAGVLRVIKNHGSWQYYLVTDTTGKNGKYLPQEEKEKARSIAQRDYDRKILRELESQIKFLEKTSAGLAPDALQKIASELPEGRRALVKPVTLTDEEYAAQWQAVEYIHKGFTEESPEYFTSRGERVRSKSEVIIAEALARHGIPYRYEYPVKIKNYSAGMRINRTGIGNTVTVFVDFYCLNPRTRQEFIWEHYGMMGDSDYASDAVSRTNLYLLNGWTLGKDFIFTQECKEVPLNMKIVERVIEAHLL